MYPDLDHPSSDSVDSIQIYCEKKRLEVYVWSRLADSYGWYGSGKVRYGAGSPKSFRYRLTNDLEGVCMLDSKQFVSNIARVKDRFAIQIATQSGVDTMVYPKGNLLAFRPMFSRAGCKF
jgi:hypothetical protein